MTETNVDLIAVSYDQIRSWIVSLSDAGLSNKSINRKIASLKSFYSFLVKSNQVTTDPFVVHRSLKVQRDVNLPFSQKEMGAIYKEGVFQIKGVETAC